MAFFDLNLPLPETSLADKNRRTKLVVKAMELGYTGIAYNRTIRGVMSDQHRCSIPLLSLSSLLKVAPPLSMSAKLHRDLLGIPASTPFRQYTRLTVCVDSSSQAQALNSGNPILRTYDLVAVRPLNQNAFDQACERMEVDIISIDLSQKLPFRLKQPMVKAAVERGVYFEVAYSGLIADIQLGRQLITNAKLLVDWTRGRSIILSSAAATVNELRGPYDVANLSLLLGLSKERAKAAISKNCRTLVANALRKKKFYKETIRVEVMSSDARSDSKEACYRELLKWDPISSGEGDLLLDDMAKSFSASYKELKPAKAIDFVSVIGSIPSHGFQFKDFMSASNVSLIPNNNDNCVPAMIVDRSTDMVDNSARQLNTVDVCHELYESSLSDTSTRPQALNCDDFVEKNTLIGATACLDLDEGMKSPGVSATKSAFKHANSADLNPALVEAKRPELQSDKSILSTALDVLIPEENEKLQSSSADAAVDHAPKINDKVEILSPSIDINFLALSYDEHQKEKGCEIGLAEIAKMDEAFLKEDVDVAEHTFLEKNSTINENSMGDQLLNPLENGAAELHKLSQQMPHDQMKMEHDSLVTTYLSSDVSMDDQKHVEATTDSDQLSLAKSVSGGLRVKRRTSQQALQFPFKRFLNPMPFKKNAKKRKTKRT